MEAHYYRGCLTAQKFFELPSRPRIPYDNEYFNIQELVTGSPSSVPYNFNDSNEIKILIYLDQISLKNISENSGKLSVFNLLNIPKEYIKPNYS